MVAEDDADSDDVENIKNFSALKINKLDVEISSNKSSKTTIGDLIGTSSENENESNNFSLPDNINNSVNFLDQFAKEAGAIRPKNKSKKNG